MFWNSKVLLLSCMLEGSLVTDPSDGTKITFSPSLACRNSISYSDAVFSAKWWLPTQCLKWVCSRKPAEGRQGWMLVCDSLSHELICFQGCVLSVWNVAHVALQYFVQLFRFPESAHDHVTLLNYSFIKFRIFQEVNNLSPPYLQNGRSAKRVCKV